MFSIMPRILLFVDLPNCRVLQCFLSLWEVSDFSCIVPRLGKQPKMQCPILMVPRVLSCVKIMCFYQKVQWEPFHSCNREARIQRNTPTGVMPRVRCTQEAEQETVRTGVRVRGDRGPIPDFKSNLCSFGQVTSLLWFLRKREGQTKGHTTLSIQAIETQTDFLSFPQRNKKLNCCLVLNFCRQRAQSILTSQFSVPPLKYLLSTWLDWYLLLGRNYTKK